MKQHAPRQRAARQHESKSNASRPLEWKSNEAARIEAARIEAARVEAAQVEAARIEAARLEAARNESAQLEASGRQEAARQQAEAATAAAQAERARGDPAQDAEARREARLRAIGRQLDEEGARRDAAAAARPSVSSLPLSLSTARRGRLFGRSDPNAELVLYAEAWSRKIQLNLSQDMIRDVAKQPHTDPMVTVAIRSDGTVESVTFVLSSGVPAIDEAIRNIIYSQVPYQVFSPGLARQFDVIEIRRTWYFDSAIRLY